MSDRASAMYFGTVVHHRLRPRPHRLRYRVFSLLLDLDELPALDRALRLFSCDRFNLFSFHQRDHGDGSGALRAYVEARLAEAGIALDGGAIRLLCYPRVLGYVFNPLSTYFCYRADGELAAILYEVTNTFAERHSYLIPVAEGAADAIRQHCAKAFYVSPFMPMALTYDFRIVAPAERVAVVVNAGDADGAVLNASFTGTRAALRDRGLARAWMRYPLLTLKVIWAIHWQALRLWRKGIAVERHPPPPDRAITIVPLRGG